MGASVASSALAGLGHAALAGLLVGVDHRWGEPEQRFALRGRHAVARRLPEPRRGRCERLEIGPDAHEVVGTAGDDAGSIGAEGSAVGPVRVTADEDRLAGAVGIPEPYRA